MGKDRVKSLPKLREIATVAKTDDAVGVSRPDSQLEEKQWYIAIVNNNSERTCRDKLEARIAHQPADAKDYEVYIAIQKELRIHQDGKRRMVNRTLFPALVFIRCTEKLRHQEIVHLPYIKRFMVNIAGKPNSNGIRPVAVIPDIQIRSLKRMVDDGEDEVTIEPMAIPLGSKVRVNAGKLMGLEGCVLESADGSTHLVIKIDMLGCAKVEIARGMLDVIA